MPDILVKILGHLVLYFYIWMPIAILVMIQVGELMPYVRLACRVRSRKKLQKELGPHSDRIREVDLTMLQLPLLGWIPKLLLGSFGNPYARNWSGIAAEVNDLQQNIGPAPRVIKTKFKLRADMLQVASTICLAVGVPLGLILEFDEIDLSWKVYVIVLSVGMALVVVGGTLSRGARRLLLPKAKELISADVRRPVVWLRSFQDDDLTVSRIESDSILSAALPLEEAIADKLHGFGPLVAVGRPAEEDVNVGASRFYFTNDEWQGEVSKLVDEALIIVMLAGNTRGLQWEFEHIVAKGLEKKLLVLFPPVLGRGKERASSLEVREACLRLLNLNPQGLLLDRIIGAHFGKERSVTLIHSKQYLESDYEKAICVAVYGMRDSITMLEPGRGSQIGAQSEVSLSDREMERIAPRLPCDVEILDPAPPSIMRWFYGYGFLAILGAITLLVLGAMLTLSAPRSDEEVEQMNTELEFKESMQESGNEDYGFAALSLVAGFFSLGLSITALAMGRSPAGWAWRKAFIIAGVFSLLLPYSIALLGFWGKSENRRFHNLES